VVLPKFSIFKCISTIQIKLLGLSINNKLLTSEVEMINKKGELESQP